MFFSLKPLHSLPNSEPGPEEESRRLHLHPLRSVLLLLPQRAIHRRPPVLPPLPVRLLPLLLLPRVLPPARAQGPAVPAGPQRLPGPGLRRADAGPAQRPQVHPRLPEGQERERQRHLHKVREARGPPGIRGLLGGGQVEGPRLRFEVP